MNILINASNLRLGGAIQVTDSICCELVRFTDHTFTVVLSDVFDDTVDKIKDYPNVNIVKYNIKNNVSTLLFGRDKYLDNIVRNNKIEYVVTVFGPSRWNPKTKHISGFARSQLLLENSPFFIKSNLVSKS